MREFKITTQLGNIYIYPIPVIKENKYLVSCESLQAAHELIDQISKGLVQHPDAQGSHFQFITFHTDQQTKIFKRV